MASNEIEIIPFKKKKFFYPLNTKQVQCQFSREFEFQYKKPNSTFFSTFCLKIIAELAWLFFVLVGVCVCKCKCVCVCVWKCERVCVYVYVCVSVCMYVCVRPDHFCLTPVHLLTAFSLMSIDDRSRPIEGTFHELLLVDRRCLAVL